MPRQRRKRQLLALVVVLFALLTGFPFISFFDQPKRVASIPLLFGYLLFCWLLLIVVVALAGREKREPRQEERS